MTDIETLAKRVILIGKGKVLYDGLLTKLKRRYDINKYIHIVTNDKIDTNIEGIIEHKKVNDGYKFVIDTNKLEVSEFLNIISENTSIDDIDIDSENLDNIIVKLYEDFNL